MTLDRLALRRGPRLVILRRHRGPLLDEGDDRPDFLVVDADLSEARHAGHVDAVLDHPEDHARLIVGDLLEVGRIGAQAFRELGPLDARPAVAIDAAALREGARPRLDGRRVVERRRRLEPGGMAVDRGSTNLGQRPGDDLRIVLRCRHVVEAAKEKTRGNDRGDDRKGPDDSKKESHGGSPAGTSVKMSNATADDDPKAIRPDANVSRRRRSKQGIGLRPTRAYSLDPEPRVAPLHQCPLRRFQEYKRSANRS